MTGIHYVTDEKGEKAAALSSIRLRRAPSATVGTRSWASSLADVIILPWDGHASLTRREREVMALVVSGPVE